MGVRSLKLTKRGIHLKRFYHFDARRVFFDSFGDIDDYMQRSLILLIDDMHILTTKSLKSRAYVEYKRDSLNMWTVRVSLGR